MKTLLIDPFTHTITQIPLPNNLQHIYKVLDCSLIEAVYPDHRDPTFDDVNCLFVDEEGLFVNSEFQAFFSFQGDLYPMLAGKAIVVNSDEDGETTGTSLTPEQLAPYIVWLTPIGSTLPRSKEE